jgi:hypothetical protein
MVRITASESKTDEQGGLVPTDKERAKAADLITLPDGVSGTNCANCSVYFRKIEGKKHGYCVHPKVDQPVNNRNCCQFWDAYETIRHFDFERTGEVLTGSTIETEV